MSEQLSAWSDLNADYIIIGDENCKPGDPVLMIPLDADSVLSWIKVLTTMLEDGEICDLPGSFEKCVKSEEI